MFDNKKGQGLSLNTIVIAIIVLVVLVVVIMIFTGVLGGVFVPGLSSCEDKGGECNQGKDCGGINSGYTKVVGSYCKGSDGKSDRTTTCCIKSSK